jgi:hypothetical protein
VARRPRQRLGHPTRGDLDAELAEQPGDLARADLDAGRAQRLRGLLRVTGLDTSPAPLAAANLDVIAADLGRRQRGEVFLILAGHPLDAERAATVRAGLRQPNVDDPADPVGVGDRPARVAAVGHAHLAARPSRVRRRGALGERGGLPLGRPSELLDLGGQLTDAGLQPLVVHAEPLGLSGELVARCPCRHQFGFYHRDPPAQRCQLQLDAVAASTAASVGHLRSSSLSSRRARRASARATRPASVMV